MGFLQEKLTPTSPRLPLGWKRFRCGFHTLIGTFSNPSEEATYHFGRYSEITVISSLRHDPNTTRHILLVYNCWDMEEIVLFLLFTLPTFTDCYNYDLNLLIFTKVNEGCDFAIQ